jgi:hypothetical protein
LVVTASSVHLVYQIGDFGISTASAGHIERTFAYG